MKSLDDEIMRTDFVNSSPVSQAKLGLRAALLLCRLPAAGCAACTRLLLLASQQVHE